MTSAIADIGRSRQIKALLVFLGAIWLAWVVANWILSGSLQNLELGGMLVAMAIVTVSILADWRSGFFMFLLWLLFEDLARKYFGNPTLLFFGKDVLAAITYISLLRAKRHGDVKFFRAPFFVPLGLFFALAVVQVFNTNSPSILYGLLGLKVDFFYLPLMFVGYAMLRNGRDLDRFLLYNVALGFLIALLGITQSIVGLQFLNPATLDANIQELASLTRYSPITHRVVLVPSSVFVSAGRFAAYMIFLIILALGTQAYTLLTRRKGAMLGFLGIGISIVAAMQSGSRGTIILAVMSILIISAGILWGASWKWGQGHRLVKAVRQSFLIGALGLFAMTQLFPKSIGASWSLYSETLDPRSSSYQLGYRTWDYPLQNLELAFRGGKWIFGNGTGTASLGMQYIVRLTGLKTTTASVENGYGQITLEMGILGLILWLAWTSVFLASVWKAIRGLRGTAYFPVAFAIFWYSFLLLIPMTYATLDGYQDFVTNAYFWILAGVLFRLPDLARMPQEAPSTAKAPKLVGIQPVPSFAHRSVR